MIMMLINICMEYQELLVIQKVEDFELYMFNNSFK